MRELLSRQVRVMAIVISVVNLLGSCATSAVPFVKSVASKSFGACPPGTQEKVAGVGNKRFEHMCVRGEGESAVRHGPSSRWVVTRWNYTPPRKENTFQIVGEDIPTLAPVEAGQYVDGQRNGIWKYDFRVSRNTWFPWRICETRGEDQECYKYTGDSGFWLGDSVLSGDTKGGSLEWFSGEERTRIFFCPGGQVSLSSGFIYCYDAQGSSGPWHAFFRQRRLVAQRVARTSSELSTSCPKTAPCPKGRYFKGSRWRVPYVASARLFVGVFPSDIAPTLIGTGRKAPPYSQMGVWEGIYTHNPPKKTRQFYGQAIEVDSPEDVGWGGRAVMAEYWVPHKPDSQGRMTCEDKSLCWKLWEVTIPESGAAVGDYIEYHPSGAKAAQGKGIVSNVDPVRKAVESGRDTPDITITPVGLWTFWYPDGQLAASIQHTTLSSDYLCRVSEKVLAPDGTVLQKGKYRDCKKEGKWRVTARGRQKRVVYRGGVTREDLLSQKLDENYQFFIDLVADIVTARKLGMAEVIAALAPAKEQAAQVCREVASGGKKKMLKAFLGEVCTNGFPRTRGGCSSNNPDFCAEHPNPEGTETTQGDCKKTIPEICPK